MDKLDFFTIPGEGNSENHFRHLETINYEGNVYWICEEAIIDEKNEEITLGELYVFKINKQEKELFMESIEDVEEFEKINKIWQKLSENYEDFDDDDDEFFLYKDNE